MIRNQRKALIVGPVLRRKIFLRKFWIFWDREEVFNDSKRRLLFLIKRLPESKGWKKILLISAWKDCNTFWNWWNSARIFCSSSRPWKCDKFALCKISGKLSLHGHPYDECCLFWLTRSTRMVDVNQMPGAMNWCQEQFSAFCQETMFQGLFRSSIALSTERAKLFAWSCELVQEDKRFWSRQRCPVGSNEIDLQGW